MSMVARSQAPAWERSLGSSSFQWSRVTPSWNLADQGSQAGAWEPASRPRVATIHTALCYFLMSPKVQRENEVFKPS